MFIEVHMIQNFAPSNLNRDDTNNPKDCEFGGVRRARISSQCIKRAIRRCPVFAQTTGVDTATRTRYIIRLLRDRLAAGGKPEAEVQAVLQTFVPAYLSKLDSQKSERTAVLLYLSQAEIGRLVQALEERWADLVDEQSREATSHKLAKPLVEEHKGQTSAPDIALFGRMLAEKPELNLEAACQVAHAISTHRVAMEMDFYTAVDDLNPEDTVGAGMMGFTGYNSACFYRYARLDWDQLVHNLNEDTDLARRTVEGFLRAAVEAVPTGKQNTFAAHNPPSLVFAVVRRGGMGWSLVNAFERPVRAQRDGGLVAPSVKALADYWERLCRVYGTDTVTSTAVLSLEEDLPLGTLKDAQVDNLDAWVKRVMEALPKPGGEA